MVLQRHLVTMASCFGGLMKRARRECNKSGSLASDEAPAAPPSEPGEEATAAEIVS